MANSSKQVSSNSVCTTGIPGLDEILNGGLPRNHLYLLQGRPGTGKTTLAMQFLINGAKRGEKVLYITFSETKQELEAVAESHGWDISGISFLELSMISQTIGLGAQNTLFHTSEIELNKLIGLLLQKVEEVGAQRVVFDSVSELRLLAETSFRYRRQMLAFKEFFIGRGSTVFFLDDMTTEAGDLHVQSIVHGVLLLEKFRAGYGVERRTFHIAKMRGVHFRAGTHDYLIRRGGVIIFPRLVAAEHQQVEFDRERFKSGVEEMDRLVGGGFDRGTSNLILGPAGSGKSTIVLQFALNAVKNGKRVTMYCFEESVANILFRAKDLGMDFDPYIETGLMVLRRVDPAELTPGQFTSIVREANDAQADMIIIDSLNGYVHAMPEQQFLILQLHELLGYLGNRGIVTLLVLSQAGIMGSMQSPLDLTYLADTVVLTRFFEAFGEVKKAVSVIKKRTGSHEETLREFKIGKNGVMVGKVLKEFSGIFSGMPKYTGSKTGIMEVDKK